MKQLLILTFFLAKALVGISQYTDSLDELTAERYLVKSRNQKGGAVVLTIVGSVGLVVTFVSYMGQGAVDAGTALLSLGSDVPVRRYSALPYVLSAAAILGAIPLFVGAANNRRKYYMLSAHVKFEESSVLQQNTINPITYPALSLRVQLR